MFGNASGANEHLAAAQVDFVGKFQDDGVGRARRGKLAIETDDRFDSRSPLEGSAKLRRPAERFPLAMRPANPRKRASGRMTIARGIAAIPFPKQA